MLTACIICPLWMRFLGLWRMWPRHCISWDWMGKSSLWGTENSVDLAAGKFITPSLPPSPAASPPLNTHTHTQSHTRAQIQVCLQNVNIKRTETWPVLSPHYPQGLTMCKYLLKIWIHKWMSKVLDRILSPGLRKILLKIVRFQPPSSYLAVLLGRQEKPALCSSWPSLGPPGSFRWSWCHIWHQGSGRDSGLANEIITFSGHRLVHKRGTWPSQSQRHVISILLGLLRSTLTFLLDLNLGGCSRGNTKSHFATSEGSAYLQNFHGVACGLHWDFIMA